MRRAWICLLGILGLVTTSCQGFTVERSSAGIYGSRNWSSPSFPIDRRASIVKMFNGEIHSADVENILRDSEIRQSVKLPDEKCSSTSEDPKRDKRSENVLDTTNHLTIVEKIATEPKETTIVSSSTGKKKSGSSVISSPKIIKNSGLTVVSSPKEIKTLESTIVSTARKMKNLEITSEKSVDSESLKNVILLLIDDAGTLRENFSKQLEEAAIKFPIQGFLQNCHNPEISGSTKFSLGDSLISRKIDEECECDRFLRANIGSMLSWARHVKEMTTGAFSTTNFSIPLSLGDESPTSQFVKDFKANDDISVLNREFVPRLKSEPTEIWRLIDVEKETFGEKQSTPAPSANPIIGGTSSKQEGINGYDGMLNVFDMFSRIRIAFFRILLESLGNMGGTENEFSEKITRSVQPSLVDLVTDAIGEFKSLSNDKGFVLVAAAPGNELSAALDVLQREISSKDTLLVISGMCSPTNEPVPFFARGPGEKLLHQARAIWDLPGFIRSAINDGCFDKSCKNQLPAEPVALPSLELSSLPEELPRKRVGRVASDEEASDSTTDEKSTKEPDDETEDDKGTPEAGKRSGASDVRVDNVMKILGIVTSFATMLALNSS